jgi:hypothetical protein
MSTDRFAVGDHLTADFNAQSYSGRLEGGYRFGTSYGGITPYAAIQAELPHAWLHRDRVDPQWLCAQFQWPRRHRHQERVGRALRPGSGSLYQCGTGVARPGCLDIQPGGSGHCWRNSDDRHIPATRWCSAALVRFSVAITIASSHARGSHGSPLARPAPERTAWDARTGPIN